jgi:hypothetical protein
MGFLSSNTNIFKRTAKTNEQNTIAHNPWLRSSSALVGITSEIQNPSTSDASAVASDDFRSRIPDNDSRNLFNSRNAGNLRGNVNI